MMSFEDSDRNREAHVDVFSVRTFSYGNHVGYNTIISKVTLKRILKRLRLSRKRINYIYTSLMWYFFVKRIGKLG